MKRILLISLLFISVLAFAQPDNTRGISDIEQSDPTATGTRRALIIGINKYKNIKQLNYAADDAIMVRDYLVTNAAAKISDNNITLLTDSNATRGNIFKELRKLLDISKPNDEVVIYFAGHGDVDDEISSGFLLAYNCEATVYSGSDAIELSLLEKHLQAMAKKKVKVLLITDACRAGNLLGGMSGASTTMNSLNTLFNNMTKVLSCQANELSKEQEFNGGGHGVFTYFLVAGLSGLADEDNDGYVSIDELETYLKSEVKKATGGTQHPKVDGASNQQLSKVDAKAKQAMAARMQKPGSGNAGAAVASRGIGDDFVAKLDVNGKTLYDKFNIHVKNGVLNDAGTENAYSLYLSAVKQNANKGLQQYMRYELEASLEDATQEWLNYYLKGKMDEYRDAKFNSFEDAADKLGIVMKLMDTTDFSYNRIQANRYFFKALAVYSAYTKGVFIKGIEYLQKADSLLPNQAYISIILGDYYTKIPVPDYEKADQYFQKAMKLSTKWSYPYINATGLKIKLRDYQTAVNYAQKAIEIDSTQKDAYNAMGWVYENQKDFETAMKYYAVAYYIDTNYYQTLLNIGALYMDVNDDANAFEFLQKAVKSNPDKIDSYYGLAMLYRKVQMQDDAIKFFQYCIDIDSTNVNAINGIGTIYFDKGQFAKSIEYFKRVVALDSTSETGVGNIGIASELMGDYKQAKKYYLRTLKIDSNSVFGNVGMASVSLEEGKLELSKKYLNKYEADQLNMWLYDYLLARYWARAGDNVKAIAFIEAAFKDGFMNLDQLKRDKTLDGIRSMKAYTDLVEQYFKKN